MSPTLPCPPDDEVATATLEHGRVPRRGEKVLTCTSS